MNDLAPAEFLYAIQAEGYDGLDDWHPTRVIAFPVVRKTPKRIYYRLRDWGPERHQVRFVDRQAIEAVGEVQPKSRQWWELDFRLHLQPPVIETVEKPSLAELKQAMADAHPDRGGTDAAFIAARTRYERARERA